MQLDEIIKCTLPNSLLSLSHSSVNPPAHSYVHSYIGKASVSVHTNLRLYLSLSLSLCFVDFHFILLARIKRAWRALYSIPIYAAGVSRARTCVSHVQKEAPLREWGRGGRECGCSNLFGWLMQARCTAPRDVKINGCDLPRINWGNYQCGRMNCTCGDWRIIPLAVDIQYRRSEPPRQNDFPPKRLTLSARAKLTAETLIKIASVILGVGRRWISQWPFSRADEHWTSGFFFSLFDIFCHIIVCQNY